MMFGYPGAGKTTTAKLISKLTGAYHLSSDKVRLELFQEPTFSKLEHQRLYDELDKKTTDLLEAGQDVIYDANLNRYQHRLEKYDICKATGAVPRLLWIQTDRDLAKQRALHDSRQQLWPPDVTPAQLFERVADVLETPQTHEPSIKLDGTAITASYIKEKLKLS